MCFMQLVAKLKAIFDRFDKSNCGELTGDLVEKMLLHMNRPVDSAEVSDTMGEVNLIILNLYVCTETLK